jgi:hypothetical protein
MMPSQLRARLLLVAEQETGFRCTCTSSAPAQTQSASPATVDGYGCVWLTWKQAMSYCETAFELWEWVADAVPGLPA